MLEKQAELENSLSELSGLEETLEKAQASLREIETRMREKAEELSAARRRAAAVLEQAIEEELRGLRMEAADFDVVFQDGGEEGNPPFNPRGIDQVEFYLSANAGEEPKPLNRIASGGELSRIILAMKKVWPGGAWRNRFDEVKRHRRGTADRVGDRSRCGAPSTGALHHPSPRLPATGNGTIVIKAAEGTGRNPD